MTNPRLEGYTIYEVVYPDCRVPERKSRVLFSTYRAALIFSRRGPNREVGELAVTCFEFDRLRNAGKLEIGH